MIKVIELQKFKRFKKSIRLNNLSSVNYLVGKNNSGKSSFLQGILLSTLYRNTDGSNFNNYSVPEEFARMKEYFSNEDLSNPIKTLFSDENNKDIIIKSQWSSDRINKNKTGESKIPLSLYIPCGVQIGMDRDSASFNEVNNIIKQLGILPIGKINSWVHHQERHLTNNLRESVKFITFRRIVNKEFGIKILPSTPDDDNNFHFKYLENRQERNLYLLGGGAQNIVYFIAAIVYLSDYDLILVDEPELHLHPAVQKRLGHIFRKLSNQFNVQFIIATQSPFIISNLTKDDNIYILKKGNKQKINKENSFINTAVAMELGGEPSDVGAPENFILLEESSMEELLRKINDRFFQRNIQFISCSGTSNVVDKEKAIKNIINHNLLLKCTPIYLSKYFIITDKFTKNIKKEKRLSEIQKKLKGRFIEMDFISLEDTYPEKYLEDFMKNNKKDFIKISGSDDREKIKNWIEEEPGVMETGKRKNILAEFIGENIEEEDFKKIFSKLLKIFK